MVIEREKGCYALYKCVFFQLQSTNSPQPNRAMNQASLLSSKASSTPGPIWKKTARSSLN